MALFTQLFISYWWILILLFLLIGILLKKIVKLIIFFVVIIVFYFIFWNVYIFPDLSAATQCLSTFKNDSISLTEQASSITDRIQSDKFVCDGDNFNLSKFITCATGVKTKNEIAFTFFINMPAYKKIIEIIVKTHNGMCLDSPLTAPQF